MNCYPASSNAIHGDASQTAHMEGMNSVWDSITNLASYVVYKKNDIIPHEQQKGVYYIKKGQVVLSYNSPQGIERIAMIYEKNTIFNEARVFSECSIYGQFKCVTDVNAYFFPRTLINSEHFIKNHPRIVQNLMFTMGTKILTHYSFLSEMGTGDRTACVCRYILNLAARYGYVASFPAGLSQQEICNVLGVHRTTLARILRKLKNLGCISSFTMRNITIKDYDMLTALVLSPK